MRWLLIYYVGKYYLFKTNTRMCSKSVQEVRVRMLGHFLQRSPKDYTKKFLQRVDLLHIVLKLRGLIKLRFIRNIS